MSPKEALDAAWDATASSLMMATRLELLNGDGLTLIALPATPTRLAHAIAFTVSEGDVLENQHDPFVATARLVSEDGTIVHECSAGESGGEVRMMPGSLCLGTTVRFPNALMVHRVR